MAIRNSKTGFALLILVFPLLLIIAQASFASQLEDSLIKTSENGDMKTGREMLQKGADVNARDVAGLTPAHANGK